MGDYNCTVSSELMINHRAAKPMPDQASFKAILNSAGHAMLFCISNEKYLNLIVERPGTKTGWSIINLSLTFPVYNTEFGGRIYAHHFAVKHYPDTNEILVILLFTFGGTLTHIAGLKLSDKADAVFSKDNCRWWILDNSPLITGPVWIGQTGVLVQGKHSSFIAITQLDDPSEWKKVISKEKVSVHDQDTGNDTIFQLAKINGQCDLYSIKSLSEMEGWLSLSKIHSNVTAFSLMHEAVEINGISGFLVVEDMLKPIVRGSVGPSIITHPLISGVKQLCSILSDHTFFILGINQQGVLFYTKSLQKTPFKDWSYPIPLLTSVTQMSTCVMPQSNAMVVFARTEDRMIVQLTQDPVTTHWHQRNIGLPSLDVLDVKEFYSYTTHVQLTKANGLPFGDCKAVSITSTSPSSCYINDVYQKLHPGVPVNTKTDVNGTITIIQETDGLGAICYRLQPEGTKETFDVNPMRKIVNTISSIKSGDELANIHVPDGNGGRRCLVPRDSGISRDEIDAVAKSLKKFSEIASKMPPNGSMMQDQLRSSDEPEAVAHWGLSYESGSCCYHEGCHHEMLGSLGSWWLDAFEAAAGDIWRWLKHSYNEVKNFFVKVEKSLVTFFVQIGEMAFKFMMKCVSDVVHAVESVFNLIKVSYEDLVSWLGFVFEWDDIVRTHNVLHNIVRQYLGHAIKQIDTCKTVVSDVFQTARQKIDSWSGLESIEGSFGTISQNHQRPKGADSPQAHWGVHHLCHNATDATTNCKFSPGTDHPNLENLLQELKKDVEKEETTLKHACSAVNDKIFKEVESLSVGAIIKRILGILADFLAGSVENIADVVFDLLEILVDGALTILDAKVSIPVISRVYKKITGSDLTILDALCLVVAIPATVVFKAVEGRSPFLANDSFHKQLVAADSWSALQKVYKKSDSDKTSKVSVDIIVHIVSSFSSCALALFTVIKHTTADNILVNIFQFVSFLFATAPTIKSFFFMDSGIIRSAALLYAFTVFLKIVQAANVLPEPVPLALNSCDCILGAAGLLLTLIQLVEKNDAKGILPIFAGLTWNLNRILSPGTTILLAPDNYYFVAAKAFFIKLFGYVQLILAFEI